MAYLGMKFENAQEIKNWSKQGNINTYRNLAQRFNEQPSMELSSMMSDLFQVLVNTFGMTPDEVEALETL